MFLITDRDKFKYLIKRHFSNTTISTNTSGQPIKDIEHGMEEEGRINKKLSLDENDGEII